MKKFTFLKLSFFIGFFLLAGFYGQSQNCDTLRYPLNGTIVYYIVNPPNTGYVTGNNSFGDLAKADYFEIEEQESYVQKVLFDFALAMHTSGSNPNISFSIWGGSVGHPPSTVLGTAYLPLSTIVENVLNEEMTVVEFDPSIQVGEIFWAGVLLPQSPGDTVVLWSNEDGNTNPGTAWEMWSDGDWYPMRDNPPSWGLNISQAIHPVICDQAGIFESHLEEVNISVYPNPTNGPVNLVMTDMAGENVTISIYNSFGQQVLTSPYTKLNLDKLEIDLTPYPEGIYIVRIESDTKRAVKKITLIE